MQNEYLLSTNPADRTVVAYFQIVSKDLPALFVFETADCLLRLLAVMRSAYPDVDAKALGYHCCEETHQRLIEAGMVSELVWELCLEHGAFANDSIYCQDRATLFKLAELFTKADPHITGKVQRFARIRRIYKDGEVIRDLAEPPYLDMPSTDWI